MPLICFFYDPIVFVSDGLWPEYSTAVHILAATSITGLGAWKIFGKQLKKAARLLSLLFYFSAGISAVLGLFLLPFSLLGLWVYFVGALGFTPLLSAFVYLRNSVRVMKVAGEI